MLLVVLLTGLACASGAPGDLHVQPFATDAQGLALGGFDPVSYFSPGGPVPGEEGRSADWHGATFRFATDANRARFVAEPARYTPQFGGHCAFGLSLGEAVEADPAVWTLRDDKLYLNASPAVRFVWRLIPGAVGRAERRWAGLAGAS